MISFLLHDKMDEHDVIQLILWKLKICGTHMYDCIFLCICICIYVYVYMYICIYVYMYICIYVYVYMYIYIYVYS